MENFTLYTRAETLRGTRYYMRTITGIDGDRLYRFLSKSQIGSLIRDRVGAHKVGITVYSIFIIGTKYSTGGQGEAYNC